MTTKERRRLERRIAELRREILTGELRLIEKRYRRLVDLGILEDDPTGDKA